MSAAPKPYITPDEYLERERRAETRTEYFAGEILAIAGASLEHNLISGNVLGVLWSQFRGRACRVFSSDTQVRVTTSLFARPDVTVVCGEPQFAGQKREILLNPTLIVGVLSPTTEAWDRGRKFEQYRERASLQEYVLVSQVRPHIERFVRQPKGQWLFTAANGLESVLSLPSIGCELPFSTVYCEVAFPEGLVGRLRVAG